MGLPLSVRLRREKISDGLLSSEDLKEGEGRIRPVFTLSRPEVSRVVQNNIEQRSVDFQLAVVFDKTELSESVHEEADAGTSCADHFRQRLLANFGNYLLWF